jgi:hypothetical protein
MIKKYKRYPQSIRLKKNKNLSKYFKRMRLNKKSSLKKTQIICFHQNIINKDKMISQTGSLLMNNQKINSQLIMRFQKE